jgi:hypothetical protein
MSQSLELHYAIEDLPAFHHVKVLRVLRIRDPAFVMAARWAFIVPRSAPICNMPLTTACLEIRSVSEGDVVIDENLVVLGTDLFRQRFGYASIAHDCVPGVFERVRIIDCDGNLHTVAVIDFPSPFDHMQLSVCGVR